jgi:hypothetical protein
MRCCLILIILILLLILSVKGGKYQENFRFNTFSKSASGFIKEIGGPKTIAQFNDLPLVPDDQNPWFWSLDSKQPVYNDTMNVN